ncbi:MAG TPA: hypothetical protein DCM54_17485 [Gammaproteobacteria bacterium]|nr:hypothetical protein [Gammaproteobacteria bacterium]
MSENQFHLIILDIGLTDAGGIEVCKSIRANTDIPIFLPQGRTKLIVFSALNLASMATSPNPSAHGKLLQGSKPYCAGYLAPATRQPHHFLPLMMVRRKSVSWAHL